MNYEEVLKKAEGKEIEARDYYTSLAKMCVNDYSKQTLLFLADQEEKHRQLIKNFIDTDEAERKSIVLPEAEDVEEVWQAHASSLEQIRDNIFPHTDEVTIAQKIVDIEKNSLDMYSEARDAASEEHIRRLFGYLAKQEERHLQYANGLLKKVVQLHEEFPSSTDANGLTFLA